MKSLTTVDVKESNRINVLKMLLQSSYSRADLAQLLKISKPTVSQIVEELIEEGLVVEAGHGHSTKTGGKRPMLLKINAKAGLIVAVHFNDSWFGAAISDLHGELLVYSEEDTLVHDNFEVSFDKVVRAVESLLNEPTVKEIQAPVICCGISIKGLVNADSGVLNYFSSVPQWREVPIRDYMMQRMQMPVFVENDARALTLAEILSDRRMENKSFVSVHMARSGIGTGVVVNKEIIRGAFHGAVTFAHTTIVDHGPRCRCGKFGCWEALASVYSLIDELGKRGEQYKNLSVTEIHRLYNEGDAVVCDAVLNYTGYWIGVGIANILNVFNPEMIVLQGQMNQFGEKLLQKITDVAKSRALPVSDSVVITYSRIADRPDLKAAAAIALQRLFSIEHHNGIWKNRIAGRGVRD